MKTFALKKRSILIGVLFLCFVWLGYFYIMPDRAVEESAPAGISDHTGEGTIIVTNQPDRSDPFPQTLEAGNVGPGGDDYFVNYRIEREKIRSQQVEILREIVNNPNSISDTRKEAQEKLLAITETLENELKLESLIVSKNFKDAIVLIQPESVTVVIKGDSISDQDTTKIADLVSSTTGHSYEDIIITSKN